MSYYSDQDKIEYYKKRINDKSLSETQLNYARKRLNDLKSSKPKSTFEMLFGKEEYQKQLEKERLNKNIVSKTFNDLKDPTFEMFFGNTEYQKKAGKDKLHYFYNKISKEDLKKQEMYFINHLDNSDMLDSETVKEMKNELAYVKNLISKKM